MEIWVKVPVWRKDSSKMIKNSSIKINGQTLHIESGRIARQAKGAAVVTLGETVVLVTAVATNEVRKGIDFLPLTVEYQEMSYAGGKIPRNYFRRNMDGLVKRKP